MIEFDLGRIFRVPRKLIEDADWDYIRDETSKFSPINVDKFDLNHIR